jgi:general secretion pathway protein L
MATSFTNQVNQFRFRFEQSQAGQFLRWWGEELLDCLPKAWRARLFRPRRGVMFRLADGDLQVNVLDGGTMHELALIPVEEDPRLHQQKLLELLEERELMEVPRELLVSDREILRKEVTMPLAAESGLAQALAFEMDRQTPFRADDVYFAYTILDRDREAGQLQAALFVLPRRQLESKLESLAKLGIKPTGVDIDTESGPAGVNLLPHEMRHRIADWRVRFNWGLAGVFLLLLAVVMAQSLWLRQQQIAKVEDAITDVRSEALRVQQVQKQIEDAREAAGFLAARRADSLPSIEILAEATRILPDDTYLDRLTIGDGTLQMQGKSANAQRLIELVNQSERFTDAAFRGPTRLDSRTQREIFDLTANTVALGGGR